MPPLPPPKSSKGHKRVGRRPTRAEAEGLKDRYVPLGEYCTNLVSTICGSSPALEKPRHIAGLEAIKAYRDREMPPFTAVRTKQQQQERDAHQQEQHKRKRRMSEQPEVYWGQVMKRFTSDAPSWPLHDKYKEAVDALSSAAPLLPIPEEDPDAANGSYENGRRNRANMIEKLDSCRDAPSFHGAPILDPQDYERSGKGAEKLADKTTAVVGLVDDLYGLKGLPAEERAEGLTSAFASTACKASSIKEMELTEKIAENTQQGGYRFIDTEREKRADMPLHIKKRFERVRGLNKMCKIKSKQAKNLNFWLHKKWKRTPADWLDYCLRNGLTRTKLGRLRRFLGFEVVPDPKDMFGPLCDLQKKLREQGFFRPCSKLIEFHGTADQSAELKGKGHAGASCAASCGNCFQNDKEMQTLKGLEKWVPKDANFNPRRPTRQGGGSSASEAKLNTEEGDEIPPPCEEEEEAKRKEGEETKKAKIQPLCRHECNCPLEPNEEGKQCGRKVLYEMNSLWRDSILINTDTLISVANLPQA
uniref:Uncharacterized protein n=1 Tax=Chromera velia CCMP2878 TaxID=1169474 RepID=A0A0K6S853_9ALVE|eukprot:Cvel_24138.t2-p1 / transcript=Cvel_24138.t2 / gene=Cvel_24138 / organism=Chromera_velia_CCMP2878 / gene_product=hypothetical protein / transcript_product=hypothetical protein / location=Cvel_scaffold2575:4230-6958(-) / protein_length=530 / sequence_SO=supercontig / SO=protein_coding / is_pseudo=false